MKKLPLLTFLLTACGGSGGTGFQQRATLPPACEQFITVARECIADQTAYARAELETQLQNTIDAWERLQYENPNRKDDLNYACDLSTQNGLDYYCGANQ